MGKDTGQFHLSEWLTLASEEGEQCRETRYRSAEEKRETAGLSRKKGLAWDVIRLKEKVDELHVGRGGKGSRYQQQEATGTQGRQEGRAHTPKGENGDY